MLLLKEKGDFLVQFLACDFPGALFRDDKLRVVRVRRSLLAAGEQGRTRQEERQQGGEDLGAAGNEARNG